MANGSEPPPPTVVQLIAQDDDALGDDGESLLRVAPEGLELLERLGSERVAVAAVAGQYRTGKSFFLNRLAGGAAKGFGVGETTEPCTRGVWLWHRPDLKAADGATLLLMDTEGLASADQDDTSDAAARTQMALKGGASVATGRGDAAGARRTFRGARRRRGRDVRVRLAPDDWTFRGDESRRRRGRDVDVPWRTATPRPRRGHSVAHGDAAVATSYGRGFALA